MTLDLMVSVNVRMVTALSHACCAAACLGQDALVTLMLNVSFLVKQK